MATDEAVQQLRSEYARLRPRVEAFTSALQRLIGQLCEEESIDVEHLEARAKTLESFTEKCRRLEGCHVPTDIWDICGIRVITYYESDIERVRALLQREFRVVRDAPYQKYSPESFGYQSWHLRVKLNETRCGLTEYQTFRDIPAEVQVRTVLQHAWAAISHRLDYKSRWELPASSQRRLFRVAAVLEAADELFADFRREVEALQTQYRAEASTQNWQQLPLDLDAVSAAWDRLPVQLVNEVADAAGFKRDALSDAPDDLRRALGNLVTVAAHAGVSTVGELARLMETLDSASEALSFIVHESRVRGFTPFAYLPDVVTLALLVQKPELRGGRPDSNLFRPEVEEALDLYVESSR